MTRKFEVGPILVVLGALGLLVSLFLVWYPEALSAWTVFEALDLLLAALALVAAGAALGLLAPDSALVDGRWVTPAALISFVIVASQILDPPPAVTGASPEEGAWIALASTVVMCLGALLTFGRVSFAIAVDSRDVRRRVAAVDARRDETAEGAPVVVGEPTVRAGAGRERRPAEETGEPLGRAARPAAGAGESPARAARGARPADDAAAPPARCARGRGRRRAARARCARGRGRRRAARARCAPGRGRRPAARPRRAAGRGRRPAARARCAAGRGCGRAARPRRAPGRGRRAAARAVTVRPPGRGAPRAAAAARRGYGRARGPGRGVARHA